MSERRCPRLWQAEAVQDGRLAGADAASFERHAAACHECAEEARALASLPRRLEAADHADPSPLELRRMRTALLERAHARQAPAGHPARTARLAYAVVVLLVLGVAGWWGLGHRSGARLATTEPAPASGAAELPPVFEVANVSGALVTTRTEGGTTRATLTDGVAAFHVERLVGSSRFLVELPDGEVEVHGTRFVVAVREARTQSVDVSEGVVALRIHDEAELRIDAGHRWSVAPTASAPANAEAAAPSGGAPRAADTGSRASIAPATVSVASTPTATAPESANERFARAVTAFQAGGYASADALLASFARDYPGDVRVEDATFLRAVALERMGDHAGAAAIARSYLATFPQGLRRREAEQLAGQPAQ